jgi:hypothetical protein
MRQIHQPSPCIDTDAAPLVTPVDRSNASWHTYCSTDGYDPPQRRMSVDVWSAHAGRGIARLGSFS